MDGENTFDHTFKILLVGDMNVGKSSIVLNFTNNAFNENIANTIGIDFKVKMIDFRGRKIKLTIWDTAGQERFRTLTSAYYRGAQGVILVYDVCQPDSFQNLRTWMNELRLYTDPDTVKLLVGNKIDKTEERVVHRRDGESFARENNMLFIECSAKTSAGIQQAFQELVQKILDTPSLLANAAPGRGQRLSQSQPPPEQGCSC